MSDLAAGQLFQEIDTSSESKNIVVSSLPYNHNNSCFIDSVLVALFFEKNLVLEYTLLHSVLRHATTSSKFIFGDDVASDSKQRELIRKILKEFLTNLRKPKNNSSDIVAMLRSNISKCRFSTHFNDNEQHDASEFLSQLFEILQLDSGINRCQVQVYATNDLLEPSPERLILTTSREEKIGCMFHVRDWKECDKNSLLLKTSEDSGIMSSPLKLIDGREFHRTITTLELRPSLLFILHIDRSLTNNDNNNPNRHPVCIDQFVFVNGREFEIHSIILHQGTMNAGHYTCMVKDDNAWSLYDDAANPQLQQLGHFEKAKKSTNAESTAMCIVYTS